MSTTDGEPARHVPAQIAAGAPEPDDELASDGSAADAQTPLPDAGEIQVATDMADSIAVLAQSDLDKSERRKALGRLAAAVRTRGVADTMKPRAAMRWIADAVGDVVPHLPIRDRDTLRRHFPGRSDMEIADRLVRNASVATASVGAVSGGVAAVEWVATPALLSAPVLLAAETVAVVAVEIKLIGELHELYGQQVGGPAPQRTVALINAWARRRGINPLAGVGMGAVLGTAARKELRDRLLGRFGRNLTSYGPFLTGAAVASYLNRRATLTLAKSIREDLARSHRKIIEA